MISTGVNGIDDMLGGGIPQGSRVLYSMEPGTDGQLLLVSALAAAISKKRSCLVVLPQMTADTYSYEAAAKMGCSPDIFKENVFFLDSHERDKIDKTANNRRMSQSAWENLIRKVSEDNRIEIIFLYLDLLYEDFGLPGALSIASAGITSPKTTLIIEHLNLEGPDLSDTFISDFSFDLVITVNSASRELSHFRYFTILHTSWSNLPKRSAPFITPCGTVIPYIPKIVVTGPAYAGKSTFVASASDIEFSIERRGADQEPTTVAMDFGYLHWKNFDIMLYGTPGQSRFDPVIPMLLDHAIGVILLVDATSHATLEQARYHLGIIRDRHLPRVIAANKTDLTGALGDHEIRKGLGIGEDVPVFCISATRRSDVQLVVGSPVDYIIQIPL